VASAVANPATNLPAHGTSLIGREEAVQSVSALVLAGNGGLVTLTGTGGSGKTRLALEVARAALGWNCFAHGVWCADLAPVSDPLLTAGAIAVSLGIKEQAGRPARDTLIEALRPLSILVVLDNCEHLVEVCAALVEDVLRICPGVSILATSRQPLHVAAERVWHVPTLPTPEVSSLGSAADLATNPSVRLFVERGQALQSDLTLTDDTAPAIARICARLDGLPLAIELAAARARVLTPEQILTRLDDAFHLLVSASHTAPPRHQTLRATLDWSYYLLDSTERRCVECLAVFAGGFDLDAAEVIWSDPDNASAPDTLDVLTELVDRSFVIAQPQKQGMRYRLLEPVRQYAQELLAQHGAWDATRRRHAAYIVRLAEEAEAGLKGAQAEWWRLRLELEHDNVRAALRRALDAGEAQSALRICIALRNFWQQFGFRSEGRRWVENALALDAQVTPSIRASALQTAAVIAFHVGDYRSAKSRLEQAAQQWRALGDAAGLSSTLVYYGRTVSATAESRQEYEQGKALTQEGMRLNRELGNEWWAANALLFLGISAWEYADLEFGEAVLSEAEAAFTCLGDSHTHSHLLSKLGAVLRDRGNLARAGQLIQQSLSEARAINCVAGLAEALYFLAGWSRLRGDLVSATEQAVEAVGLQYQVSDAHLPNCLELVGGLLCEQGRVEQATRLLSAAATLRTSSGSPMPPILRATYERDLAIARKALGPTRFSRVWGEASTMSVEQAVEYARRRDTVAPQLARSDPLSRRERQVIALLARGYTNRQIADELVISERTVDGHVTHILSKLELSSRALAAIWAVEHQLAAARVGV